MPLFGHIMEKHDLIWSFSMPIELPLTLRAPGSVLSSLTNICRIAVTVR